MYTVSRVFLVLLVAAIGHVHGAAYLDTILKLSYPVAPCLPASLPRLVEVECQLNSTVSIGGGFVYCNCTADRSHVIKWTYNAGVYTYVGNFTTNTCTGFNNLYASVNGVCGGGEPYDNYLAHLLEAHTVTTQRGTVNTTWCAGLFWLVFVGLLLHALSVVP